MADVNNALRSVTLSMPGRLNLLGGDSKDRLVAKRTIGKVGTGTIPTIGMRRLRAVSETALFAERRLAVLS